MRTRPVRTTASRSRPPSPPPSPPGLGDEQDSVLGVLAAKAGAAFSWVGGGEMSEHISVGGGVSSVVGYELDDVPRAGMVGQAASRCSSPWSTRQVTCRHMSSHAVTCRHMSSQSYRSVRISALHILCHARFTAQCTAQCTHWARFAALDDYMSYRDVIPSHFWSRSPWRTCARAREWAYRQTLMRCLHVTRPRDSTTCCTLRCA